MLKWNPVSMLCTLYVAFWTSRKRDNTQCYLNTYFIDLCKNDSVIRWVMNNDVVITGGKSDFWLWVKCTDLV